jgi:hypothetical protein
MDLGQFIGDHLAGDDKRPHLIDRSLDVALLHIGDLHRAAAEGDRLEDEIVLRADHRTVSSQPGTSQIGFTA